MGYKSLDIELCDSWHFWHKYWNKWEKRAVSALRHFYLTYMIPPSSSAPEMSKRHVGRTVYARYLGWHAQIIPIHELLDIYKSHHDIYAIFIYAFKCHIYWRLLIFRCITKWIYLCTMNIWIIIDLKRNKRKKKKKKKDK